MVILVFVSTTSETMFKMVMEQYRNEFINVKYLREEKKRTPFNRNLMRLVLLM